jgi:tryptophan synthase beta chain
MFPMYPIQYNLPQSRIPQAWHNILPDLPKPLAPVLHPGTLKPIGPDDLAPLFPMGLILQEVSTEHAIEIPEEVRQVYAQWRPTPLFRARRLEKALDTPAKIYYKYEGVSPAGSHKPNTAVPQAYYNKKEGTKRLATETGAGQWGSSLAMACTFFGLECKVYMVRVSYNQKPYRRALMEAFGASVTASPSDETESGRAILAEHPHSNGSLGIAISEAVEVAAKDPHTKYALGSVLNHVLLHQTVIGLEAIEQMSLAGDDPDVIVGCTGGGSNFAGLVMPYLSRKIKGQSGARVIAVEPAACPSLTKGKFTYDFGDTAHLTPLVKMFTLGSTFMPPGIHAAAYATTAWLRWCRTWWISAWWKPSACNNWTRSRPGFNLPAPRESSRRLRRTTPLREPSARLCVPRKRENSGPSCSICAGMGTSTCNPTSITMRENCKTTNIPLKRSPWRWPACPR